MEIERSFSTQFCSEDQFFIPLLMELLVSVLPQILVRRVGLEVLFAVVALQM